MKSRTLQYKGSRTGSSPSVLVWASSFLAALSVLALSSNAASAQIVTFSTDQTGANTQIDNVNSQVWDFSVNPGFTVSEIIGNFEIKLGPSTVDPIIFSLYDQFNGTGHVSGAYTPGGNLLGSATILPGAVTQSFTPLSFDITGLNLSAGPYSVALQSNAGSNGSEQYFFKGHGGEFITQSPEVTPGGGPVTNAEVPEASGLIGAVIGIATVGSLVYRRRKK
ncbi:MAG: hypothetical protein ABJA67_10140 [Chthonomonadales bacterium]